MTLILVPFTIASIMVKRIIAVLGVYALSIIIFPAGCKGRKEERPDIILISVDTLRPDHLGCYGYEKRTSPHVDKFAKESVLFSRCFAHAPETGPSCTSFLSGFLPHETGVVDNLAKVPQDVPMLAEILSQAGYKTYAVVSNFILKSVRGYSQGFQHYDDHMDKEDINRPGIMERVAEKTTDTAISILQNHEAGKFFLWIHYQDPHGPYIPKGDYKDKFFDNKMTKLPLKLNDNMSGKGGIPDYQRLSNHTDYYYYVSQYDGEIGYFDEHFGRLIDFLRHCNIYDNSLVIFTADHGESLGEHGYYFSHGENLTNALIHVPLIIRYKGIEPGLRGDIVQHLDLVPTILSATAIKNDLPYRGRDILEGIHGHCEVFSQLKGGNCSIILDGMKLVTHTDEPFLYDITQDSLEVYNLAKNSDYKGTMEDMSKRLERAAQEDRLKIAQVAKTRGLTPEERERFKSLGYVDHGE